LSSDKLATQSSILLPYMTPRKPKLDWIKEVLADLEDQGERVCPTSLGTLWRPRTAPADFHPMNERPKNDRSESLERDDRLFCPSRQLMRHTAARKA
jgi:hypothetical protein